MQECEECGSKFKVYEFHKVACRVLTCEICKTSKVLSAFDMSECGSAKAVQANLKAQEILGIVDDYCSEIKFKILVWGPATSGVVTPEGKKRVEIRQELEAVKHEVSFSEDACVTGQIPLQLQEYIQKKSHHLLICVCSSFGSVTEASTLIAGIKEKALVWLNEEAKHGFFANSIARTLNSSGTVIEFFTKGQLESCVVKTASVFWVQEKVFLALEADRLRKSADDIDPRRI